MGWICKSCGTENDFSILHCQACDAVVDAAFIRRESTSARIELTRFRAQLKRQRARERMDFSGLRRFHRTVYLVMTLLVLGCLGYTAILALQAPDVLANDFSRSVAVLGQKIVHLPDASSVQLKHLAGLPEKFSGKYNTAAFRFSLLARRASAKQDSLADLNLLLTTPQNRFALKRARFNVIRTIAHNRFVHVRDSLNAFDSIEAVYHAIWSTIQDNF